ncbi:hypothetical protein [Devosia sp. CAU 1758]
MSRHTAILAAALVFAAASMPASMAQDTIIDTSPVACPSQQELEQAISSEGSILSEECIEIDVSRLMSNSVELCLIDFGADEGFLGRLRDAAFPTQWWVECSDLEAALQ